MGLGKIFGRGLMWSGIFAALFLFISASQAYAAITPGTGTPFSSYTTGTTNVPVTVAAGTNSVLFVSVSVEFGSISSVSYNGISLTKLWNQIDGANVEHSSAWILVNPPTGSNALSITWPTGDTLAGYAQPWYGVAQGGTQGTTWRAPVFGNDGGTASPTASEVVSNAVSGDMVLDVLADYAKTPAADSSQTVQNQQNGDYGNGLYFGTSNKLATGATTMQWTMASAYWAFGAFALIPAPPDVTPPSVPTGLAVGTVTGNSVALSWTASTDNVGVTGYNVYRNGTIVGAPSGNSYTDGGLTPLTGYTYTVSAFDASGNTSAQSASVSATTQAPDTTPPSTPTNLTATAASSSQINLAWTASTDNVGVTGYSIYRAGVKIGTSASNNYADMGLAASTQYTYTVAAFDAANNLSPQSASASATTPSGPPGCTGSGTTWGCTPGSSSTDVQNAINNASDGAVITFAPGSYTLSTWIRFLNTKGATLICASVGACTINFTTNTVFGGSAFDGVNNHLYRISGFNFNPGGNSVFAAIWFDAYDGPTRNTVMSQIRIDHNSFSNFATGGNIIFFGDVNSINNYYGVIDHNTLTNPTLLTFMEYIGTINPSWPPSPLGTANNIFLENNTITIADMGNASAGGCTDSWGGAAIVARYNTSLNCLWASHGATHAGGPQNYEFYGNTVKMDAGSVTAGVADGYRSFHSQGSGDFVAFNNSFTSYSGKNGEVISVADYRSFPNSIDGGEPQCDGTVTDPPDTISDGNRSPQSTYEGYPCWHQPGRDFAGNLVPMYAWNNYWSDTGAQIPMVIPDFGGSPDYLSNHEQANRDYYNAVSASAQTSPTSPFNGTTGMGFGTLANRPTTCTTDAAENQYGKGTGGVGYFATDVGSQGTLYQCSAPNTWTVWYTPYTYPYPLVTAEDSGGGGGGPPGDTTPPTTSITAPTAGATISGSSVSVFATASDNVGVTQVQLYLDGALVGTDSTSPYTFTLNTTSLSNGSHTLMTKAYDAAGNVGSSINVPITVSNLVSGGISFIQQAAGAAPGSASSFLLSFPGNTTAGDLVLVGFDFAGTTVKSVTDSQGNAFSEVGSELVSPGASHARVYYAQNIKGGADTMTVTLNGASSYIELYLTEYASVSTVTPIDAQAGASGPGGAVSSGNANTTASGDVVYGFCIGDLSCSVGSGFSALSTFNNNLVENMTAGGPGSYAATAAANSGWTMQMVALRYSGSGGGGDTIPPSVPTGLSVSGTTTSTVSLIWTASTDNVGVTGYKVFRNGVQVGTPSSPSFTDAGLTASTAYSYTVSAFDAAGNNSAQSASVNATTQSVDTTPPTVSLTNPPNNSNASGTVIVAATASDNVAVAQVQFTLDGSALGAPVTSAPYQVFWNTLTVATGTHTLAAVAKDTSGNQKTSSIITVTVTRGILDTTPPTTNITSPLNNAVVSGSALVVTTTASDNVGVTKVELYVDNVLKATDTTSPYNFTLDTTALSNGSHVLTTKAYDAAGNIGSSPNVTVTVSNAPQTLTASLSGVPISGTAPVSVSLTATAAGTAQGTLNYIFYCNRSDTGTNVTSPADLTVNAVATNPYLAANLCSYQTAGTYTAKVIIERGSATPAQAQQVITVSNPVQSTSTPSLISSVTVGQITDTSAQVMIVTTQLASVQVSYGPTTSYGATTQASPALTTIFVNLSGLTQTTTYHFDVIATAQGSSNPVASQDFTFTTQATQSSGGGGSTSGGGSSGGGGGSSGSSGSGGSTSGSSGGSGSPTPSFSVSVSIVSSTATTAKVAVTTSLPAITQLFYGTSPSYGSTTIQSPLLTTSYFNLTNLTSRKLYYLKAVSLANGQTASSPGINFAPGTGVSVSTPSSPSASATPLPPFTRNLSVGSTGSDITELQSLLVSWGYLAASPTGYFGNLTKTAVIAFQRANNISPASGLVGPLTRAKLNSLISVAQPTTQVSGSVTQNLAPGSSGAQVTELQTILTNDHDYAGPITGYYGSLTEQGVEAFQTKYGIVTYGAPDTTGYGAVGPRTRTELNGL